MPFTRGAVIADRFLLERELGSGGYGVVWLAEDRAAPSAGSRVALKLLHARLRERPQSLQRFAREAQVISKLEHANIARALDWSIDTDPAYVAIELVEGMSLRERTIFSVERGEHIQAEELARIFGQLCSAIAYAHANSVVHRDLKPSNVMLAKVGGKTAIKVLDFGIAKILEEEPGVEPTTVGRTLGSPAYLSPEQIASSGVDQRSDVFALGTLLFELLTLRRAWIAGTDGHPLAIGAGDEPKDDRNDRVKILGRIARGERPKPSAYRSGLGSTWDALVTRAIAADRDARFDNVETMHAEFERALATAPLPRARIGEVAAPDPKDKEDSVPPHHSLTWVMPKELDAPATIESAVSPVPFMPELTSPRRWDRILLVGGLAAVVVLLSFALRAPPPASQPAPPMAIVLPKPIVLPKEAPRDEPAKTRAPEVVTRPRKIEAQEKPPPAIEQPPPDPFSDLRAQLARARERPNDAKLIDELAISIGKKAELAKEAAARTAIKRCASQAAMVANVDALAQCIDRLTASVR